MSRLVLAAACALFYVRFTRMALGMHAGYGTSGYDLGIFDQGVWLLSRFKAPFITIDGLNLFGDHASFIVLFITPLYWIWPSPATLLVVQSLALTLGAVPAFLIGRRLLRSDLLGLAVALAYLLHPNIAWTNVEQFHPDAFEAPLLLLAILFTLRQRWRWVIVSLVLLVLCKEDMAVVSLALGLYIACRYDRQVGAIIAGASLLWLPIVWGVILPHLREGLPDVHSNRVPFGGMVGFVSTTLKHPGDLVQYLVSEQRPWYVFQILVPFALLPLLSPFALVALGPFLFNLLSTHGYQHIIRYHYSGVIIVVMVVATAMTLARVRSRRRRGILAGLVLVLSLWSAYLWGPSTWSREPLDVPSSTSPYATTLRRAESLIPPGAAVSASAYVIPHLTHRQVIFNFPTPFHVEYWANPSQDGMRLPEAALVEYVLVTPDGQPEHGLVVSDLLAEGFQTLIDENGVQLLQRKGN
jgi:uncharacterized membrane protein